MPRTHKLDKYRNIGIMAHINAGKTTTTGLLGWIFDYHNLNPSVYCGAGILNWKNDKNLGNIKLGNKKLWIIESDESHKSLLKINPTHSILTNIGNDHLPKKDLIDVFKIQNQKLNAFDLTKEVIEKVKIIDELKKDDSPEGISRVENVQELLNGIRDFIEDQKELVDSNNKLSEFLSTVSLSTDFDIENEDQDKVSLMTLHLSKGLEFKHVFIVGLEEDLFPSALSYNTRSELEEERRLFYVGITRAKENLYLSYANSRYRWGKLIYCEESRFLNEIDKEYLKIIESTPSKTTFEDSSINKIIYNSKSSLKRLPKTSESLSSIKINVSEGDNVSHEKFGIGEIIKIEGSGNDSKATVNFKKFGLKNLLLRFAKLNKV